MPVPEKLAIKGVVQLTALDQAPIRRLRQVETGTGDDTDDEADDTEAGDDGCRPRHRY
ncbi:hypothetical protein GCM10027062_29750 [Nocardioides hungaricus]